MKLNSKLMLTLLSVQFLSLFGTTMGDFALSLHLYQESGSIYFYSFFSLFILLPSIIISPIIGYNIDKYNKKILMLIGHAGAGICSIFILILLLMNYQNIYIYIVFIILSSFFNGLVFATIDVFIGNVVEKDKIQFFGSLDLLAGAALSIMSPILATTLLSHYSIVEVFYIDIATFIIALITISSIKFNMKDVEGKKELKSILSGLNEVVTYLKTKPTLVFLVFLFAFIEFGMAQISVFITPLSLHLGDVKTVGYIMAISGMGMIIGGVISMSMNFTNHVYWIVRLTFIQILFLYLAFVDITIMYLAIATFFYSVISSVEGVIIYTYLQQEVKNDIKGRVFSFNGALVSLSIVLGLSLSAPLSEEVMPYILESSEVIQHAIGEYLFPPIRLLFIINATLLLIGVIILEYKRKSLDVKKL